MVKYFYNPLPREYAKGVQIACTVADYTKWLCKATPGEKFVYYQGNSPADTMTGIKISTIVNEDARQGKIFLTRRKIGPFHFEFLAIKASNSPPPRLIPEK